VDDSDGADGSTDGGATDELPDDLGDIEDLEGMEDALANAYEEMGLTEEQAECLAGKLSELVEDGDLSEEEAMTEVFGVMAECDISMEDLTGGLGA
jgi:hypothetical protein